MVEFALGLAIASFLYSIYLTIRVRKLESKLEFESMLEKHIKSLSDETIKDIIENAIPETNK